MAEQEQTRSQGEPISGNLALCAFAAKSHLFKKVAQEDIGLVYKAGRLYKVPAGQLVVREGDPGSQLFLIVKGTVQLVARGPSGTVELDRLSRGAIFGEVCFLTGKPRTASVMTIDAVEIIGFTRRDLDPILKKYPKVRKLIQVMMSARAENAIEKMTS